MKNIFPFLILIVLLYSCKTTSTTSNKIIDNENATIFYLIRHAEKTDKDINDPELSKLGLERVTKYIEYFKALKLNSVYTTNYKRTFQTAKPIALSKAIKLFHYDPNKVDYSNFIEKHKGQSILIVGHSNTTPNLANGLIGNMKYTQMMYDDYSSMYKITVIEGEATSVLLKNIFEKK